LRKYGKLKNRYELGIDLGIISDKVLKYEKGLYYDELNNDGNNNLDCDISSIIARINYTLYQKFN
jgi:hypothetical protein